MQIPTDAVIPVAKLTRYLLVPRVEDDKSKFLGQAGFCLDNFKELEHAIRKLETEQPATVDGVNDYGKFYRVEGMLVGPNGRSLPVASIWLQLDTDGSFNFVTLKPRRAKR